MNGHGVFILDVDPNERGEYVVKACIHVFETLFAAINYQLREERNKRHYYVAGIDLKKLILPEEFMPYLQNVSYLIEKSV